MKPQRVAILFGGQSAEHAVSLMSAKAVFKHLDRDRFQPVLIHIGRDGRWAFTSDESFREESFATIPSASFLPWLAGDVTCAEEIDIYFPVLHGPNGEDGRIQSLLELSGVPFVGAASIGSMLAMDKAAAKHLFRQAGLAVPDYLVFTRPDPGEIARRCAEQLRYPLFVKPCALGSSVGISRVEGPEALPAAVTKAFSYDRKIIVENGESVREIEVAVMGNDELQVSRPGELIPHGVFYDFADKYLDGQTQFRIPMDAPERVVETIQNTAAQAYRALFLNGMARVDLFICRESGQILVNEINTIPGFTEISMFPKLFAAEGISFTDLLTRLIELGFAHHQTRPQRVDEDPGR